MQPQRIGRVNLIFLHNLKGSIQPKKTVHNFWNRTAPSAFSMLVLRLFQLLVSQFSGDSVAKTCDSLAILIHSTNIIKIQQRKITMPCNHSTKPHKNSTRVVLNLFLGNNSSSQSHNSW